MAHMPQKIYHMNYFYTQNMQQFWELNRPKNKCICSGPEEGKIGQKLVFSIDTQPNLKEGTSARQFKDNDTSPNNQIHPTQFRQPTR